MPQFDAIIIGTGQAGPSLAARLTNAGMQVAVVERGKFGGTCVNTGCMPTKTLVASAYAAHVARPRRLRRAARRRGARSTWQAVKARKDDVSAISSSGVENWLRGNGTVHGLTRATRGSTGPGDGRSEPGRAARADASSSTSAAARPRPPIPGLDRRVRYLTNTQHPGSRHRARAPHRDRRQLHRPRVRADVPPVRQPGHGGRDGAAAGGARGRRCLGGDRRRCSTAEGIAVRAEAQCLAVEQARGRRGRATRLLGQRRPADRHATCCWRSAGVRTPTISGSNTRASLTDARGYITVDDQLRTNIPGIWALGDCNGRGAFTHTAYNDFEIVAANLLDNDHRSVSDRIPAYDLYTDPPLGRVGMTEARSPQVGPTCAQGRHADGRGSAAPSRRARRKGFMRVLVDAETKQILGGVDPRRQRRRSDPHHPGDMMYAGAPYTVLQRAMHIHPTVSELLPTLVGQLKPL